MNKNIEFGSEARKKLVSGINKVANAVTSTLGPNGRNIIYTEYGEVRSTKDGVTCAKQISDLEDPTENIGAQMIKQASIKTANNAGDGTTTSTLLAQAIINEGLSYLDKGANAVEIKRGIDSAVKEVITCLRKEVSKDITSETQLEQVATISANNDPEIGKLIAAAMEKVGREGVVHIEESKSGETYLETVEGMQFDRGYKSHYFVTDNNSMNCTLEDPYILIADKKFTQAKELLPILEGISSQGKPLLIIAEDIEAEALSTLVVNKIRGTLKVAAVKAPDFGDRRKLILEDIATMTGGQVFSTEKGMKMEKFSWDWLGSARLVTITKDQTTLVDGKGTVEKIEARIEELQAQIEKSVVPFEKEKLQERLSKFIGGVAIIHVGGNSELEMKETKDRVDDALHATKAAIEEGIVPGGGAALLYAREAITEKEIKFGSDIHIGKKIVYKACAAPFMKILTNAGYTEGECYGLINGLDDDNWKGYNIKTGTFVNMKEAGIIDPSKVTRNALENAASVAGVVLLTEAAIVEVNNDKKEEPGMPGMY
jgi:chaperonin GroEL